MDPPCPCGGPSPVRVPDRGVRVADPGVQIMDPHKIVSAARVPARLIRHAFTPDQTLGF